MLASPLKFALAVLFLNAVCCFVPNRVVADVPSAQSLQAINESEVLDLGRKLEQERRWHEAILHYERAAKKNPNLKAVLERLQVCRVHHDVTRRYSDRSFLQTIDTSSPSDALEVFSEVIAKLEVYYVERVDYYRLALHGTAFLEVALTEPDFLGKYLRNTDRESIENFRKNIHKSVFGRKVIHANDLKSTATFVAKQASDQLGIPITAVIYEYIAGSVGLLDPYSALLTPGEYREVMSQIEGNLIGLGVELWAEGSELRIVDVFRGGPAFYAGLAPQQQIVKVDGMAVREIGAKKAADLLRGPEGSQVRLQLQTADERMIDVRVERRRVEVPSVSIAEMAEPGIGYIRITNFQKTTPAEVGKAMFELSGKGMKSLIIDLRKNPGGLLDAAVELADQFLHEGTIVSTQGRNGHENHNFTAKSYGTWDIPLVLLIDEDSASASEIFAGAMHDHSRATIVGQTSYGKGSVQGVFHNEKGNGGLRLTVSKFYSPNGTPISANGIQPNVPVESESQPLAPSLERYALKPGNQQSGSESTDSVGSDSGRFVKSNKESGEMGSVQNVRLAENTPFPRSTNPSASNTLSRKIDIVKERGIEMARSKIRFANR
jgi:carboxyl-terminal processing protease